MKVLKFGGTSVGSVENIEKVISIIEKASQETRIAAIVSAFGGVTDQLIHAGNLAAAKDSNYVAIFNSIKERHLEAVSQLHIDKENFQFLDANLRLLEDLLKGIFYINELSPRTKDRLVAFGELCSSIIIAEAMKVKELDAKRKNATELIITQNEGTLNSVNLKITSSNIGKNNGYSWFCICRRVR
jgi:aspartokinase/homoserine dehydrogenase 1